MRFIPRLLLLTGLAACGVGDAVAAPEGTDPPPAQTAVWQMHHAEFNYYGLTSRYTCDGLELKVRQILEYLGARPDVYVLATGCPRGPESISRTAYVRVDFSTLVAAPDSAIPADSVQAAWTPLRMKAMRPSFMGDGDCELVQHMQQLLTDNFSWRGKVDYRTDCPIETVQFNDYQVEGELLKSTRPPAR